MIFFLQYVICTCQFIFLGKEYVMSQSNSSSSFSWNEVFPFCVEYWLLDS